MCINCYEMIPAEDVEVHSNNCIDVAQSVVMLDSKTYIDQIEFKITKLINALQRNQNDKLSQIALEILQEDQNDYFCMKKLKECIDKLQLLKNNIDTFQIIYVERLIVLTREKLKETLQIKSVEESKLQQEINDKSEELAKLKSEVNQIKSRTTQLIKQSVKKSRRKSRNTTGYSTRNSDQNNENNTLGSNPNIIPCRYSVIDELRSNVSSQQESSNTNISLISSVTEEMSLFDPENIVQISSESAMEIQEVQDLAEEEKLRQFYGICLSLKLKFRSKDLAQYVQVSQLYEKAKQDNIAQEKWPEFIKNELENAERWVNIMQLRKSMHNKLGIMETIIEEEEG